MARPRWRGSILRFAVLGELRVTSGGRAIVERPSHRRLLSLLLLDADRPVSTAALIDRFWQGEPPATARAAIQTHVSELRKLLGVEVIRTTPSGYALELAGHELDAVTFASAADDAYAASGVDRWQEAVDVAEQALALWRGPPFQELADDGFARPEIVRLQEMRLGLIETWAGALLEMGRPEAALPQLERAALEHPLRERMWELLMTGRARAGRTADALAAYQELREALAEMGLDPSPALRELHARILREDHAVVGAPTASPTSEARPEGAARDGAVPMSETIAFLFADVEGSTRLLAEVGAEAYAEILATYRGLVTDAGAAHGGEVVDREGDGLFLVFPTAVGALRAAVEAQAAIVGRDWPRDAGVRVRIGVHAGEAQQTTDGYVGLDVHVAARVGAAGFGGQVLVSDAARTAIGERLPGEVELRDLDEHRLQGIDEPVHLYQACAPGLPADFPPLPTRTTTPTNLPTQPTSFVGRERELTEVAERLTDHRLVTLTGVGGAGKTRLALEAAARALGEHPDGVWLAELAGVTAGDRIVQEVARVVGAPEAEPGPDTDADPVWEGLASHLADRRALLLLDNCEHLLDAVGGLCDLLLRACPEVRILATSREPLGIAGESTWQVPPLGLADPTSPEADRSDAVRLFIERARLVDPSFALQPDRVPTVARICERLDGIPLAIELAAARVRVLSLEQLAERLDDRFRLLTGGSRTALPRHRTLEATIAWSYDLLEEAERRLFARLSVFAGSFSLASVEEVCAGDGIDRVDVLELIAHLVDKSLLATVTDTGGPRRYRLLETLRQYARERLDEMPAAEEVRRRHRDRYRRLAVETQEHFDAPDQLVWLKRVDADRDNLEAALAWSRERSDDPAIADLAAALAWHAGKLGQHERAIGYLRTAIARTDEADAPERAADLRSRLAGILYSRGEERDALAEARHARDLVTDTAPSSAKVRALTEYASMHLRVVQQDPEEAIAPAREAVAAARETGERFAEAHALRTLGTALSYAGATDEGTAHLREALALARELGNPSEILGVYMRLFIVLLDFTVGDEETLDVADEIIAWLDAEGEQLGGAASMYMWCANGYLRGGRLGRAEAALERSESYHLEGMASMSLLTSRALLDWMRGRLDAAESHLAELGELGPLPRYYRVYFPLRAEIAASRGRSDEVRAVATEHLDAPVDDAEEPMKTGSLFTLVRVEVAAALDATGDERAGHLGAARAAVDEMRALVERSPDVTPAGFRFELPETYVELAEAELSRATSPDPDRWHEVVERPSYAYWRAHARARLAGALHQVGQREEAVREFRTAHQEASEMDATLILEEIESLTDRIGVDAEVSSTAG